MERCGSEGSSPYCYFHPKEFVVGICAICLKERLLALALKQPPALHADGRKFFRSSAQPRRPVIPNLPKVFALASLLHLLEPRHSSGQDDAAAADDDKDGSIASLEDWLNWLYRFFHIDQVRGQWPCNVGEEDQYRWLCCCHWGWKGRSEDDGGAPQARWRRRHGSAAVAEEDCKPHPAADEIEEVRQSGRRYERREAERMAEESNEEELRRHHHKLERCSCDLCGRLCPSSQIQKQTKQTEMESIQLFENFLAEQTHSLHPDMLLAQEGTAWERRV